jgi:uncharacterized OB-fold protein
MSPPSQSATPQSGPSHRVGTVSAMPDVLAVRDGLLAPGEEPTLIGGRCRECQSVCFPAQDVCPYCSEEAVHEIELSRTGTLWAWTAVTAAPPGYEGRVPYGFGVVELAEGVRLITRLTEADPAKLEEGQAMVLVLEPLIDEEDRRVLTYAFAPV